MPVCIYKDIKFLLPVQLSNALLSSWYTSLLQNSIVYYTSEKKELKIFLYTSIYAYAELTLEVLKPGQRESVYNSRFSD